MRVLIKYFVVAVVLVKSSVTLPVADDGQIIFPSDNELDLSEILMTPEERMSVNLDDENVNIGLESGSFFQGDIKLLADQKEILLSNETDEGLLSRTGILIESQRWPKNKLGNVVVPFAFKRESDYTTAQKNKIRSAMDGIERHTCVRFVRRTKEEDYIKITSGRGCYSNLGKVGQDQEVSLNNQGCLEKGTIQHELIHSLGYDHMHSDADRDKYIQIKWANILPSTVDNFSKVNPKIFGNFGTKYDLYSVMHYHGTAFSKNGKDTIVPINSRYKRIMGQRIGISAGDAKRINNMYKCSQ